MSPQPTIHLSFDQDWAPAWATLKLRDMLRDHGAKATFFVTQDCPSLPALREAGWELGWHPNFLPGSSHGDSLDAVLDTLSGWVPDAKGARAHCLIRGTPYLEAYKARGLSYDAADLHDGEAGLKAFTSWTGLVRLPIFFEDDVHLQRGHEVSVEALGLSRPGLKIFTFHPVLVVLNAADLQSYQALKSDLAAQGTPLPEATEADIAKHAQTARPGMADLLTSLLNSCEIGATLAELAGGDVRGPGPYGLTF
jgi:hypothetical protein